MCFTALIKNGNSIQFMARWHHIILESMRLCFVLEWNNCLKFKRPADMRLRKTTFFRKCQRLWRCCAKVSPRNSPCTWITHVVFVLTKLPTICIFVSYLESFSVHWTIRYFFHISSFLLTICDLLWLPLISKVLFLILFASLKKLKDCSLVTSPWLFSSGRFRYLQTYVSWWSVLHRSHWQDLEFHSVSKNMYMCI